jgi:hypothetical protein
MPKYIHVQERRVGIYKEPLKNIIIKKTNTYLIKRISPHGQHVTHSISLV